MQISKNVQRIALFMLSMVFSLGFVFAQERTITGKVTAEGEGALPGVNVVVQGTTIGAITDANGTFTVKVPGAGAVLIFSSIGYVTQSVTVGAQATIDVVMVSDTKALQEVVVVGYGTRMKEQLTGAISTVSDKDLKVSPAPSTVSRLQGHVSGVTITNANTPGGDATIRIRGVGTINDPDPLYVIDGVPVGPGNNINPDDVESISVLKDASSAAIYGTRGANGVILITTKKGAKNQKATVSFSAKYGFKSAANKYNLLNTQEYANAVWLEFANKGIAPNTFQYGSGATPVIPDYIIPTAAMNGDPSVDPSLYSYPNYTIVKSSKPGTDWYKEILQNGVVQDYNLTVSGGNANTIYSLSTSYYDEKGIEKYTDFKRYNFRLNMESQLSDFFKVGQSLQTIFIDQKGDFGDNSEGDPISQAYRIQPIIPVYDIAGNFAGSKAKGMGNAGNPLAQLYRAANNDGKWMRAIGTTFAEATLMKGLSIKTLLGYNVGIWNSKSYGMTSFEASEPATVNSFSQTENYSIFWNWVNTLNYNVTIAGQHKISVVLGTEASKSDYQEFGGSRSQYFSTSPDYMYLNSGEINKDNYGYGTRSSLWSQFGRVNYDLMGKYYVEATVRRDGSSRFGKDKRYGVFPAASVGWTISQENFMKGISGNWLNNLKIRAGWGTAGNDRIGDYNGFSTYTTNNYTAAYDLTGSTGSAIAGFIPSTRGSNNVGWETTTTINVGLDGKFLNNTLSFSLDVWNRKTSDMLYQLSVPEVLGLATPPYVNIGDMTNKGFDLQLGYNNTALNGKLTYGVSLVGSHYKNELTKMSNNPNEIIYWNTRQVDYSAATQGHAFPEFYGYQVLGIFQSNTEASNWVPEFGGAYNTAGHFKFANVNKDTVISSADRKFIGSPHPKFTGGLNIDLAYAGFDLNLFFYSSYGNKMINYVARWIDYGQFDGNLSKDALYNSWTPTNKGARLPMLDQSSISQYNSTAFVEDGSFLRLKNFRLGYTLPKSVLDVLKMRDCHIYLQMTNLFTITKYRGLDPELNSSGMSMGIDQGAVPTPREISFGITLGI
ncbi:MAG TPA: TonB-dependent receptor [Bacteroidales bacterium]|nr:TonB-dependent receptor [Bacteroidales bacterium]